MKRDLTNVKGYIYKLTSPNGKTYIGQTVNKKQRKYHYNSGDFKQQTKLWNSVSKYNWNPAETYEIIEECLCGVDKEILNKRETYWIDHYNSFKSGLNCNVGGDGNLGNQHSAESKRKMSEAKIGVKHPDWRNEQKREYTKGRKHTDEAKLRMSEAKIANMTDDVKSKISEGLMGNQNGIGNSGSPKKVVCLTNNKIYNSIKEAANELGLHSSNIIATCKGKQKYTGGYKFKYNEG